MNIISSEISTGMRLSGILRMLSYCGFCLLFTMTGESLHAQDQEPALNQNINKGDQFQRLDSDQNQLLSLEEMLGDQEGISQAERLRFYQLDSDIDGWLSKIEFNNDQQEFTPLKPLTAFQKIDKDQNWSLSQAEFTTAFPENQQERASTEFENHNLNQDETLSLSEFYLTSRAGLDASTHFRRLDRDRNDRLTRSEFLARYQPELRQWNRLNFHRYDLDDDQQLTLEEYKQSGAMAEVSLLDKYWARDANEDGTVSREEYFAPNLGTKWEKAAKRQAVQFDLNKNGVLSILEFSLTPQGTFPDATLYSLIDRDHDERVTLLEWLAEHQRDKWSHWYSTFSIIDEDRDQLLSLNEFLKCQPPKLDSPAKEPPQDLPYDALFKVFDQNVDGQLQFTEITLPDRPELEKISSRIWWREIQFGFLEQLKKLDADGDFALSLKELAGQEADVFAVLLEESRDVPMNATAKYLARDLNNNGVVIPEEYYSTNLGTKWEETAKQQSVTYDLDQDGKLSLLEFSVTPQGFFPSQELFPQIDRDQSGEIELLEFLIIRPPHEWHYFGNTFVLLDRNANDALSLAEFSDPEVGNPSLEGEFSLEALAPADLFSLLDRSRDQAIQLFELKLKPRPPQSDPQGRFRWEEIAMLLEETFEVSDQNQDQHLNKIEFVDNHARLLAAMLGRPPARVAASIHRLQSQQERSKTKVYFLIAFNIVVVIVLSAYVRKLVSKA